jgi:ATP-binding cassette subfamily B protein
VGFIMNGLDKESYDRVYDDRALVRRIAGYFRPRARQMALVALMVVLAAVMNAIVPVLVARGLDRLDPDATGVSREVWGIVGIFLVAGALAWAFNFVRQAVGSRVTAETVMRLRADAFDAVMQRDMSFYDETPSGRVVSRVTSDTDEFAETVNLTMNLVSQVLLVLLVIAVLAFRSLPLTAVALAIAPVVVVIALAFRRLARRTTLHAQRALSNVNTTVQETMSGISVAKAFRQEQRIFSEFKDVNAQTYRVQLHQGFVFSGIFPVLVTVAGLGTALIFFSGGRFVLDNRVSSGDWYLFIQSVSLFWFPMTSIASFWSQFQQGLAASERIFALVDAEPRVVQRGDFRPELRGGIAFKRVDFAYIDGTPVLSHFDLEIAPGETVALVGHTGAGKSTIGKLITRFYEFQGGELLLDGQDIRSFDLATYRRQLGVVPQTPFLFTGTVASNIRYARPDATDAEVEAAARAIGGGDWLDVLPAGLQSEIGERGRGLSMGQRQLVALARVLLQNPAIVILDEATASVDPLTEAQIQEGLDVVLAGRTSIVIAHRLSTIRAADRIVVLEAGRVVEMGTHDALTAAGGQYARLYDAYFRHQSIDYAPWLAGQPA